MIRHGDKVKMRLNRQSTVEGMIWVDSDETYFIHNDYRFDGYEPPNDNWRGEYRYSWTLSCTLEEVNEWINNNRYPHDWDDVELIAFGSRLIFKMT